MGRQVKDFKGRSVRLRDNENISQALRRFKKKVAESRILEEVRTREFYEKPTTTRKRAKSAAKARYRKKIAQQQLPDKNY